MVKNMKKRTTSRLIIHHQCSHLEMRRYLFHSTVIWQACSIGHLVKRGYEALLGRLVLIFCCQTFPNRIQQLVHRTRFHIGIGIPQQQLNRMKSQLLSLRKEKKNSLAWCTLSNSNLLASSLLTPLPS
jgi:hypothetical protein